VYTSLKGTPRLAKTQPMHCGRITSEPCAQVLRFGRQEQHAGLSHLVKRPVMREAGFASTTVPRMAFHLCYKIKTHQATHTSGRELGSCMPRDTQRWQANANSSNRPECKCTSRRVTNCSVSCRDVDEVKHDFSSTLTPHVAHAA
jgi:hypothetical protein